MATPTRCTLDLAPVYGVSYNPPYAQAHDILRWQLPPIAHRTICELLHGVSSSLPDAEAGSFSRRGLGFKRKPARLKHSRWLARCAYAAAGESAQVGKCANMSIIHRSYGRKKCRPAHKAAAVDDSAPEPISSLAYKPGREANPEHNDRHRTRKLGLRRHPAGPGPR